MFDVNNSVTIKKTMKIFNTEGEGFEPSVQETRTKLFESFPIDHSGIPPKQIILFNMDISKSFLVEYTPQSSISPTFPAS